MKNNMIDRIPGRTVLVDSEGRETNLRQFDGSGKETTRERVNGPHNDAKWARYLLNTPSQREQRRLKLGAIAPIVIVAQHRSRERA